jgi:uncharacterized membrane protein YeaQ/YmgE (transglycosylase-associated protein family)
VLTAALVVGLVVGWLSHRVWDSWFGHAPVVTWAQPVALAGLAALLGLVAWATYRSTHPRAGGSGGRLEPHQAVNRLVLARACAIVGALVGGFYLGYAVSWLWVDVELAHQRLIRSLVAAVGGGLIVLASLLLERACRVTGDDPEA